MKQITIYDFLEKNKGVIKNGWVCMDCNYFWKWFSHKPHKVGDYYWSEKYYWECYHPNCKGSYLSNTFNIAPFDGDWKDSLIKVEHKEEE